jgi:hypothetical protein
MTTLPQDFLITCDSKKSQIKYANSSYSLEFQNETTNDIIIGRVLLIPMGEELSKICNPEPITGFEEYTIEALRNQGITLNKIN